MGGWFVVLAPVVGGLLYGPLIWWGAREARGHGVPEVMRAVAERGGRIRPRVAIVKSMASALCIGSGGSVGREGPIVQIGSAIGSTLGQALRLPESRLRLLVACGAAGGISATFNAPIAGAMFALELILRDFEAESFGAVVVSSVFADVVGRAAFGSRAFLTLPPFDLASRWEYLLYGGLGLVAAVVGVGFFRAPLRNRGRRRSGLARPGMAPSRRRGARPGPPAPRRAPDVRGRLSDPGASRRRRLRRLVPPGAPRRKGRGDEPDDRDRRLGWRLRALPLHRGDAGHGLWPAGEPGSPADRRIGRGLRTRRHGRRLRRGCAGSHHRRADHLRAHRGVPHHPAPPARRGTLDVHREPSDPGHDLHAQAEAARDRAVTGALEADAARPGRRGHASGPGPTPRGRAAPRGAATTRGGREDRPSSAGRLGAIRWDGHLAGRRAGIGRRRAGRPASRASWRKSRPSRPGRASSRRSASSSPRIRPGCRCSTRREASGPGRSGSSPRTTRRILLYVRESVDETYVVAVGMDETAARTGVAAGANLPGDPRRLLGDATLVREGPAVRVTVPAGGTGVFRVR